MAKLRRIGLQKLAAGRHIVEQVPYGHRGSVLYRRGFKSLLLTTPDLIQEPDIIFGPLALEGHLRHGTDRGHRLPPETERAHPKQVVHRMNFRSGVPFETEANILLAHAAAIVDNLYQGAPGVLDNYPNPVGPRVDGVVEELFDDRGGSLNDFPGGDLVGNLGRELMNDRLRL